MIIVTDDFRHWGRIKVTRIAPIVDLLDNNLRREIHQLYDRLTFRSPHAGVSGLFDFDGAINGPQKIQRIIVGSSDSRIESITVRYASGFFAGPYGPLRDPTRSDCFNIAPGTNLNLPH